jgi:thymidine phosphorylase
MQYLNTIARTLWSPWDISAWIEVLKKLNKKIKEGETIMICYSNSENKMEIAKELLELKIPYEIK